MIRINPFSALLGISVISLVWLHQTTALLDTAALFPAWTEVQSPQQNARLGPILRAGQEVCARPALLGNYVIPWLKAHLMLNALLELILQEGLEAAV